MNDELEPTTAPTPAPAVPASLATPEPAPAEPAPAAPTSAEPASAPASAAASRPAAKRFPAPKKPQDEFRRAPNEDDDGYDPWSDRRPDPEPFFERDPWR